MINRLIREGAVVSAFDSIATEVTGRILPEVTMANDPYSLAKGCDAIIVLTPRNEFRNLDLGRIKNIISNPIIIDGRNIYDPDKMKSYGFIYRGIGRGFLNGDVK